VEVGDVRIQKSEGFTCGGDATREEELGENWRDARCSGEGF
jgi:hypothetical protein